MSKLANELKDFLEEHPELTDLNNKVKEKKINNYGMDKYLDLIEKYLMKLKKNNVLIIGAPGIGKSALVEKLAEEINNGHVPEFLQNKRILELSLGSSLADTKYRGEFEEKIQEVLGFVSKHQDIILYIDEVHNLASCGKAEGAIGAGDIFKPFMGRDELTIIGATTIKEYEHSIKKDGALDRRFTKLYMKEPSIKETIDILKHTKISYEEHYNIELSVKEIEKIAQTAKHHKGSFPDKAFDEMDNYCFNKAQELV